jgi:hypothetical protein
MRVERKGAAGEPDGVPGEDGGQEGSGRKIIRFITSSSLF